MEDSTGGSEGHTIRPRTTLLDHISMSAVDNRRDSLVRLTLDAVLKLEKRASAGMGPTATPVNRTLLDIMRDEEPHGSMFGHKDKNSWKAFRDRLRLKRAGGTWTSLVQIPTSDARVNNNNASRSFMSHRNLGRFAVSDQNHREDGDDNSNVSSSSRPEIARRSSSEEVNFHTVGEGPASRTLGSQVSRHSSIRFQESERVLSGGGEEMEPVRMSLMDLLEETDVDRQMGFKGWRYVVGTYEEEEEEEEKDKETVGGVELAHTCCVCMVRHKGAAFIPCGHTFCRLCSRELWVQRGSCPLCNDFILEVLDIF